MQMTVEVGPRLTDEEFFTEHVDTSRPGLADLPAAMGAGDYAAARRIFAADARASLQPERFLRINRRFLNATHTLPGESVEAAADRILNLNIVSCSTPSQFKDEVDWFSNPTFNQYKEWTWQISRHPDWALLGERYRDTGNERFAEGFVKLFQSWVRQTGVEPLDSFGGDTKAWRTIECGIRMGGSWQWALHSFYNSPHFTDDVLVDWYKSVWEHGWRLRHHHRTHNWLIMEMNGLAQIGILYPQFAEADEWRHYAFDVLVREMGDQVYADGMQYELSTGYHQVNINNYQWLWDVAEAYNVDVPAAFRDGLEQMHAANVKLMMPDGRLPDINDGGWHLVSVLMQRAADLYPAREDFRWAATRGRAGSPPSYDSIALPYSGLFVMRSGWDEDAVYAFFDGGPFGYAHQHEDKLNLLVHAHGRLLVTEAGNYAYDTSEMRRYVLSTRGHNTIRVDGEDQNRRINFDRSVPPVLDQDAGASWHSEESYDVVVAKYDEGYGPDATHSLTHRRKVIFLKEGVEDQIGPCFVVVDRLDPQDGDPHEIEILWHLNTGMPTLDGVRVASEDDAVANVAIVAAAEAELAAEVVHGQEEPEWQGWRSFGHHQQGEFEPIPTIIYRGAAAEPTRIVTLITPLEPGKVSTVAAVHAATDIDARDIEIELLSGKTVKINEGDYPFEG
ncbi:MAG: alginate lyase family protein [Caldilineaceae bacterium]